MGWQAYTADGERKLSSSAGALGWEIIERKTPSAAAESVFQLDNTKYSSFQIVVKNLKGSIDSEGVRANLSIDGGATWITVHKRAGYTTLSQAGGINSTDATGETHIKLSHRDLGNNSHDTYTAIITIGDTAAGLRTMVSVDNHFGGDVSSQVVKEAMVVRLNINAPGEINAIRIYMSSGTVTGDMTLLGLPKTIKVGDQIVLPPNGWQTIETRTVSGASEVVFNDIDQFDGIEIVMGEMTNSFDNADFRMQVSTDNGSGWIGTNYRNSTVGMRVNSATITGGASTNLGYWTLINALSSGGCWNNADANHNWHIRMMGIQTTATKDARIIHKGCYAATSGGGLGSYVDGIGVLPNTGAKINAVRLLFGTGTLSGKFTLLGLVQ